VLLLGHILLISQSNFHTQEMCQWTVDWILENDIPIETTVYLCDSVEMATKSLQNPIQEATPPSLIILDHEIPEPLLQFSALLKDCLPESWVIDLIPTDNHVPEGLGSFVVSKPVSKDDWFGILEHIFKNAHTPQWSKTLD
jgi:hypothetical protein